MLTASDATFMQQALRLAMRGRGLVEPNPMVGCVIVKDGRVIGEGWHRRFGGPHAEREALAACDGSPAGATAYVTLEPCCHTNKKTPPCVPGLIEAKVARVIIACADPNPEVAGRGIAQLRAAGIVVETGLMEAEAKQLNAPFFARIIHQRPYVTLKWAQTADGKVAGPGGERRQISNSASMRVVHELRSRCDAILVGIGTVLADDPLLTVRGVEGGRRPMRVVLDSRLRLPSRCKLVESAGGVPVLILHTSDASPSQAGYLQSRGVRAVRVRPSDERMSLPAALHVLHAEGVTHLLVEAGPTLATSFIREGLADRIWVFQSPTQLNSPTAPAAPAVTYAISGELNLEGDRLTEHLNPASPVFFASVPSADFTLVSTSL